MTCEIITIGDEILIGQIIDTNSAWMAQQLNKIGISVQQMSSVQDTENAVKQAVDDALGRTDLVLITGGLGPTNDDITKKTLTAYFYDQLTLHEPTKLHIQTLFNTMGFPFRDIDLQQAMLPSKALILKNKVGTASGMWFTKNNKVLISMPGVPTEMKTIMTDEVLPRLQSGFQLPYILHKTIVTIGVRESDMSLRLQNFEKQIPENIKLAYLPNYKKLRLRLTAKGTDKNSLELQMSEQVNLLHHYLQGVTLGYEDFAIEKEIQNLMVTRHKTLSTAESFTGGNLAHTLTLIPGSSQYFKGSVVSYHVDVKVNTLGVSRQTIDQYSVVSEQVVAEMAKGVLALLQTDYAIATTGNAGPTTDLTDRSVGDVYIGIATSNKVYTYFFNFGQPREKVIQRGTAKALELFYQLLEKNEI